MSSCRPTSPALALLGLACTDHLLTDLSGAPVEPAWEPGHYPVPGAASEPPEDGEADNGEPPGPPCHGGVLGPEDGRGLSPPDALDPTSDDNTGHFAPAWPTRLDGQPAVWAWAGASSGLEWTAPEYSGAYLLSAADWRSEGLPVTARPLVTGTDENRLNPRVGGLTTLEAAPGEASWFREGDIEGRAGTDVLTTYWLFASTPGVPVDPADADASIDARYEHGSHYGDLDGDGLDDTWIEGRPGRAFLAPYSGAYAWEDSDFSMPEDVGDATGFFMPMYAGLLDLDHDGYTDILWGHHPGEVDTVAFKRGPFTGAEAWSAPDGTFEGSEGTDLATNSQDMGTYAGGNPAPVGDVTGDGAPDAVVGFEPMGYDDTGPVILYVLDRAPRGAEALESLAIRVVGPAGQSPENGYNRSIGPAGLGDFNGDGWGDLVLALAKVDYSEGSSHRAYVLAGPLDGTLLAEEAPTVIDIPATAKPSVTTSGALLVPDLDLDGLDDVLVSTGESMERPATLWLYPGCEDW
jgi:hypothetical protein